MIATFVIPAKAGIQLLVCLAFEKESWIPACAGMTGPR
jgi:hypothetical protein